MTMTEVQINAAHKERYREAAEKYGSKFRVPRDVDQRLGEMLRQDWLRFYGRDEQSQTSNTNRRDKTKKLHDYVKANPGANVTAESLADAVDCSTGTAHAFIRDNRSAFRAGDTRGHYLVVDQDADRAAARRTPAAPPTLPVVGRNEPAGTTTARSDSDAVEAILGAMTGSTAPRRAPGKP